MDSQLQPQSHSVSKGGFEMKIEFVNSHPIISCNSNTALFPFTISAKGLQALGYTWEATIDYTEDGTIEFYRAQLAFRGLSPEGNDADALKERLRTNDLTTRRRKCVSAELHMRAAWMVLEERRLAKLQVDDAGLGEVSSESFPRFRKLPPELRRKIWGLAIPYNQVISVEVINTTVPQDDNTSVEYLSLRRCTQYPEPSRVNKESRGVWKDLKCDVLDQSQIGQPDTIRYHPADVFLLWTSKSLRLPSNPIVNPTTCDIFSPFTHIAIDTGHKSLPGSLVTSDWYEFLSMFRNLKSHTVINSFCGAATLGSPLELELVDCKRAISPNDGRIPGERIVKYLKYSSRYEHLNVLIPWYPVYKRNPQRF